MSEDIRKAFSENAEQFDALMTNMLNRNAELEQANEILTNEVKDLRSRIDAMLRLALELKELLK